MLDYFNVLFAFMCENDGLHVQIENYLFTYCNQRNKQKNEHCVVSNHGLTG